MTTYDLVINFLIRFLSTRSQKRVVSGRHLQMALFPLWFALFAPAARSDQTSSPSLAPEAKTVDARIELEREQFQRAGLESAKDALRAPRVTQKSTREREIRIDAVALFGIPSGREILVLKFSRDWVEWTERKALDGKRDALVESAKNASASAREFAEALDVITKDDADKLLRHCHPEMKANVRSLQPPFFNQPTNVKWDSSSKSPILRAFAVKDRDKNECVRADLNLRTSELLCRPTACAIH